MDKQTLDRKQPWRQTGMVSSNIAPNSAVMQQADASASGTQPTPHVSLTDVPEYQRTLHCSVTSLGIRLSNVVDFLHGNPSNKSTIECGANYGLEEAAPISAIVTRIHNTQHDLNICAEFVNMIEARLGIG